MMEKEKKCKKMKKNEKKFVTTTSFGGLMLYLCTRFQKLSSLFNSKTTKNYDTDAVYNAGDSVCGI